MQNDGQKAASMDVGRSDLTPPFRRRAARKSLPLFYKGRWHGEAVTEGIIAPHRKNPLSHLLRKCQLPLQARGAYPVLPLCVLLPFRADRVVRPYDENTVVYPKRYRTHSFLLPCGGVRSPRPTKSPPLVAISAKKETLAGLFFYRGSLRSKATTTRRLGSVPTE